MKQSSRRRQRRKVTIIRVSSGFFETKQQRTSVRRVEALQTRPKTSMIQLASKKGLAARGGTNLRPKPHISTPIGQCNSCTSSPKRLLPTP